ncbi:MAG: DnaA regulatory inactivator Hda [Gammaproteobacteria bacterium]
MKGLQLPLGVQLPDTASFETYFAGPNAEAVAALRAATGDTAPPLVLLFGPAGTGKSHLLQALTRAAARTLACAYAPLRELAADGAGAADTLDGLERSQLVCLDDVDAVLDRADWPLALLRLLDALRAHGGRAVVSAPAAPERLALELPDLRTRLAAAAVYGLKPLSDHDRTGLLLERARARGLDLPEDAARHLLSRLPRNAGSLVDAIDRLDRALLSAQRRLTLSFVQQWLKDP